jgi:predicted transcriptional regulator
MALDENDIAKSATMTVRLTPEISKKLGALARNTRRSKSYLAGEAIASFVDVNAWQVARIKQALDEARSGAPGIPHRQVAEWMNSWGADHTLPRPESKSR